jgi:hypothetical protein
VRGRGRKGRLLNLRFDVLVQAKEVLWVVLLFDGHKPGVVRPECGFNRVFSLFAQVIQVVCFARERTYRSGQVLGPFNMELRLSWIRPLREKGNGVLGLALRKGSFGDPNRLAAPP